MSQNRVYKVRTSAAKGKVIGYSLSVPPEIGRALSDDVRFACEITEEGILYKPVEARQPDDDIPKWATTHDGPTHEDEASYDYNGAYEDEYEEVPSGSG